MLKQPKNIFFRFLINFIRLIIGLPLFMVGVIGGLSLYAAYLIMGSDLWNSTCDFLGEKL